MIGKLISSGGVQKCIICGKECCTLQMLDANSTDADNFFDDVTTLAVPACPACAVTQESRKYWIVRAAEAVTAGATVVWETSGDESAT